jgi:hypothetical protein
MKASNNKNLKCEEKERGTTMGSKIIKYAQRR